MGFWIAKGFILEGVGQYFKYEVVGHQRGGGRDHPLDEVDYIADVENASRPGSSLTRADGGRR